MDTNASQPVETRQEILQAYLQRIFPPDAFFFDSSRYPTSPGCYLMKDRRGKVLYVGKAKSLRDRLSSYFQSRQREPKIARLVARVSDVEVILVNSEWESLVLENNLIKRFKPRYNARLKADDSGYYYIIQTRERFPRLLPYTRGGYNKDLERIGEGSVARRYGPYASRRFRDLLLEFVIDHFGFRTCDPMPKKACLRFDIRRCNGPCASEITLDDYLSRLEEAAVFLSYEKADIVEHTMAEMRKRIQSHVDRMEFECARRVHDRLEAMNKLRVKQIVERDLSYDQDVLYFDSGTVLAMTLLKGAVNGVEFERMVRGEDAYLMRRYRRRCPTEIIANLALAGALESQLSRVHGANIRVRTPESEEEHDLIDLCRMNHAYRMQLLA